ncbi:MAG TPA: hypothetical protein VJ996_04875 [Solirubrobacteraceae bacterium]|nr:hypothetical protein [Solirubrobacteraceae bacterium]
MGLLGPAADSLLFPPVSELEGFSFSADAPPDALVSLELSFLLASLEAASPPDDDSSPVAVFGVVDVVELEVVCTDAFSALVSVGGVISGVLFGTASETLLPPPHALKVTPQRSVAVAASRVRPIIRRSGRESVT